jgi:hypothetical protein
MPNEKSTGFRTRLSVEALEAREVPASFGATRGLSIATGDILPSIPGNEYITGTGPGTPGLVRVWDTNGKLRAAFKPFGDFSGGVYVAVGQVNSDNQFELICSTAAGTTGQVKVYEFTGGGRQLLDSFTPFGAFYTGGVQIAAGNVAGGRAQEVIVGQQSGGSTVKVFAFDSTVSQFFQIRSFQAYPAGYTGGVTLASANIDATLDSPSNPYEFNYDEIITGRGAQLPQVRIFDAQLPTVTMRASYMAFDISNPANLVGINVAAGDTDGLRSAQIYVAKMNSATIRFFDGETGAFLGQVTPYPPGFSHTVNMAIANMDDDFLNIYNASNLVVVAGDGAYAQHPLLYPGKLGSPAGLNGSRPA